MLTNVRRASLGAQGDGWLVIPECCAADSRNCPKNLTDIIPTSSAMALNPGVRLGPYKSCPPLAPAARARCTGARHEARSHVAIKVLPEIFASDPERSPGSRGKHKCSRQSIIPHIGAIYGLEEAEAFARWYRTGRGSDARRSDRRGAIPLDEALPIARQIAEALEAAHERRIIHRDLKPANIKVRPDGRAKVLDFGLAKALEVHRRSCRATQSPTSRARR